VVAQDVFYFSFLPFLSLSLGLPFNPVFFFDFIFRGKRIGLRFWERAVVRMLT